MPYLSGFDRNQSFLFSLDNFIDQNNSIRLIDAFVDALNLSDLGFITYSPSARGQQPYDRSDLLKLNLYGYVNGIRSSRKLEREATRNIELMWLLNNATPAKSCISDFVKNNKSAIQNTFKKFIDFLKSANFIDSKDVVIDGTKIRSQNSRNKYYSLKKIDSTISFFEAQIEKYVSALQSAEASTDSDPNAVIPIKEKIENYKTKIEDYKKKIEDYKSIKSDMTDKKLSQITLTDPDSRMMTSHGNSDISYNLQTAVNSKNSLIVACDVVNDINDTNQLENMVSKSTENLSTVPEISIADMGYFNIEQIVNCENLKTKVFVKRPKAKNATNNSDFSINNFKFDPDKNVYICPAGKELTFSRNLRKKKRKTDKLSSIVGFEYSCPSSFDCPYFRKCTDSLAGRKITRNVHQDILDKIQKRFDENPDVYTLRKCVVEHPFGTIKRSLGYTYFLRKGLESVGVEATLICLAYNFKRLSNISKITDILEKMRQFFSNFLYNLFHFLQFQKIS